MADDPSIKDALQRIVDATTYSTYANAAGKAVSIVKVLAKKLLTLALDETLPPKKEMPAQFVNELMRANTANIRKDAFNEKVFTAYAATDQLQGALEQMASEPNDGNQRIGILNNLGTCSGRFVDAWSTLFPALEAARGDSTVDETRQAVDEIKRYEQEAKATLAAMQDASKELGAGKHAQEFTRLAAEYQKRANCWRWATICAAVVFGGVVFVMGYWTFSIPMGEYGKLVQVVAGKVLLLGVVYYMIVFCARSYRATAHLAAINLHRATALQVFETFANSSGDEQTKNAILLETTRCIYSHTSTGFLSGEDPSSPIQIVEILKALGPRSGEN